MSDLDFSVSRSGDGVLALLRGPEGTVSLRLRANAGKWFHESAGVHTRAAGVITWGICPWVLNGQCHYMQIPDKRVIPPVKKWARKQDNFVLEEVMWIWYYDYTGKEYLDDHTGS